ncbi:MAG TPA: site-specific integrase, partial [Anaerolineae bacterium]|nr:site-specific integrase [Anaerolineae bacterium]
INQRLSAIRRLATEAADNGAMSQAAASGIRNTPGLRQAGQRQGNWLPQEQAQRLLTAPDTNTLKGLRDRAILAVMLGCGLRRSEVAALTFAHVQQRQADDGRLRWLIVDLIGKGNKTRSVVMPDWAKAAIDAWASAAGLSAGPIFRQVDQWGHVGDDLSEIGVSWLVKEYAAALGLGKLAAHDLRRTYAKLARRGGAALEQVQYNLGHSSLKTTERYLGTALDLAHAPCDALGLKL